jgi:hypothetical protein
MQRETESCISGNTPIVKIGQVLRRLSCIREGKFYCKCREKCEWRAAEQWGNVESHCSVLRRRIK